MNRLIWITGPSGVGKTTVAWRLWTRLKARGVPVAYVDIDQLGMCFPASCGRRDRRAFAFGGQLAGIERSCGLLCVA
jgi:adenylylsulfate kinase-like enzyme